MLGAIVPIATTVFHSISFQKPSDQRAAKVMPGVIQSALSGNLTAVRCLYERSRPTFGIASERAVWLGGYNQVVTQRPELLTAYNKYKDRVPAVNNANPETAAASALANPFSAPGMGTPDTVAQDGTPNLSTTANQLQSAAANAPLWLTLAVAGGLGYVVYRAVKK